MILVIITFGSLLIGLIGWWYYEFFKHSPSFAKYPGPSPIPVYGNLFRISSTLDIIPVLLDFHKKYGPVIKMWFGYRPRIIISDYRTAEILLESTSILDKSYDYKFFSAWLGTGLLTSTGTKWKVHRKLLTPTFHFQILEKYIHVFNTQSEILVESLRGVVNAGPVDICPFINLYTLDIICETAMGININAQKNSNSDYVRGVAEMTNIIYGRMFSIFKTFDTLYRFTNDYKREQRILSVLHGLTNSVIKSKEQQILRNNHEESNNTDDSGIKKRVAFLDLLLQKRAEGANLSTEDIREEVDTFMFEGHDTTSSALCFILFCLGKYQECQEKVVQELKSILMNDICSTLTYQNLQDMKYLEMVIKESLRLYPTVPIFARELARDTEFDGVIIPKGTNLTIFTNGLHKQEEMFPEPEQFDPERFTLENAAKRSPFAYLPFSAGIRNCIGQRFAMLELKATLSKILINYKVLPVPDFEPILSAESVLRSSNGILLNFEARTATA